MDQLQIFNFEKKEVRTAKKDNDIWFCLKDVCSILEIKNHKDVVSRLNQKGVDITDTLTNGGMQKVTFINESNLYKVIFQSRKPQAEKFTEWVTSEVLPTIRKTGRYEIPKTPMEAMKLMFEAQEQTNKEIYKHEKRITDLEENKHLEQGEYSYIQRLISNKVKEVKKELNLKNLSRPQISYIFKSINRNLNAYIGVKTRTQFKQKDFNKAIEFIENWELSYTDIKIIEQMGVESE